MKRFEIKESKFETFMITRNNERPTTPKKNRRYSHPISPDSVRITERKEGDKQEAKPNTNVVVSVDASCCRCSIM